MVAANVSSIKDYSLFSAGTFRFVLMIGMLAAEDRLDGVSLV
jgi:hypothetical protein